VCEHLAGSGLNPPSPVRSAAVQADLLFDPFGGRWEDLRDAALLAEESGFDGVWLYDHLAGSVHRASHVLECWTVLSALAAVVPQLAIGSLVLNVANRDAGTLGVMAATLQEVAGGRLMLGVGAGGGAATPYAAEQLALGRPVPGDATRRAAVESTIATLREVWSGTAGGIGGFLEPSPPPPVIVGGFGPKMSELAGRLGDGINAPPGASLPRLLDIAREAHAAVGRNPDELIVTTSGSPGDDRLIRLGVDRVITMVRPPYTESVGHLARTIGQR
jgi:alkanesulfonate monooxygenase SsuD/methylene tetrahydromethanopterin reductase-like flavin-dependent oxidoreductase (luciferase family)